MTSSTDPKPHMRGDTPDSLRQQAAACRRLASSSRTRSGSTALSALADHFEAQASKLEPWSFHA